MTIDPHLIGLLKTLGGMLALYIVISVVIHCLNLVLSHFDKDAK